MQKITITIPDNLSPQEEAAAIFKLLGKNLLPPSKQKMLGSGYEIKHLNTQINIIREAVEKPIVTHNCMVCQTVVEHSLAKKFVTNYGGKEKKHYCCSDGCRDAIMSVLGVGRAAMTSRKLVPVYQR